MQALVEELTPAMLKIDPMFEVIPTVNKTISRVYRDTRFSKDKSPYKTNQWITFKRPSREWQMFPAYFFELSPDSYRFGMGFFSADRTTMDLFRASINRNSVPFLTAISFYDQSQFQLEGDTYKRLLRSDLQEPLNDWYNRKSFYLVSHHSVQHRGIDTSFAGELALKFTQLAPLYQYLEEVIRK